MKGEPIIFRGRVTPDPAQAAELERRQKQVSYYPENGLHKDKTQIRSQAPKLRLVK